MSLPRPGGPFGEKKAGNDGSGYAGNPAATHSAFAGYTPPATNPQASYNPSPAAAGSGGDSGSTQASSRFSYSAPGAGGSGGGTGAGGAFGGAGIAGAQGFGGAPVPGGALGGGGVGTGGDKWDQYGFSASGLGAGGSASIDAFGGPMGATRGGALGGQGMAQQPGTGAGGAGARAGQPPLDWHQWAPGGVNKQVLNMGESMMKNYLENNVAQYQPRVSGYWNTLKVYFTVDNGYVLRKLNVILFPVLKKDWYRMPSEDEVKDDGRPKYERPVSDVNAPDLYVPLMSFITFVLVTGYAKGAAAAQSNGRASFSPEVLTEVTSSCVVIQLLEVVLIRLGLYLLQSPAVILDLVAYTGYQYVGLCINMTLGICIGKTAYYVCLLWTGLMMSFFMFKTMAHTVPTGSSSREIMILGFGILQLLSMAWLGHANDLS